MIRCGQKDITRADNDAVVAILKSVNLTQGLGVARFGQSMAVKALYLGPGDWRATTTKTCILQSKLMSTAEGEKPQKFVAHLQLVGKTHDTSARRLSPNERRLKS